MSRPADRCPGVFSAHPAADGYLARIRLPGGRIEPAQLEALAGVAARFGDAHLELTSRGNLQVRGITDLDAVAEIVVAAGLIPTPSHERVRNLQLSALSGRRGGNADLRPVLGDLDARLRADPVLADLPARFLFGLDDGRGDILAQLPDAGLLAHSPDDAELVIGGVPTGRSVPVPDGAVIVLAAARAFLDDRTDDWRVADLADRPTLDALLGDLAAVSYPPPAQPSEPLVGWLPQDDGLVTLGAVVAHARLPARTAEFLAAIGTDVCVTPNREILVCDLSEDVADTVLRVLAPLGLIFDEASPWARVSSCTGSPGCARSNADVRGDLELRIHERPVTGREHWCGCERRCGLPHGPVTAVVATPTGYRVGSG
ncbi:MAG TPA: precorrin-3B synthase [Aldersonia sp.]